MDRTLRLFAYAVCGATFIWLHGCDGGATTDAPADTGPSVAEQLEAQRAEREAKQAAEAKAAAEAAASAEAERLASEGPSEITNDDFVKGSKAKEGGRVASALGGALAKGEEVHLMNLRHNLEIHAAANEWPESHEEFMELVEGWKLPLPELKEPYEYWYNAEDHQIYKRPK